ncbi:MAG: pilus assembly protein N-terminal domain-containing protein [Alphaproteobacteria bacterium]|nr:pilus assembly protein N-terminal domain-containing protein [Alphaproteobacteria bacterium]
MVCLPRRLVRFAAAAAFIPLPAFAGEIDVPLDNVKTVTLSRPAKTIYVGNPAVADITLVDARHIFVLGKAFGSTNLVALDASGDETLNDQIIVTNRLVGEVTVQRGVARATMMCTPQHCQQAPAPGDDAAPAQTATALSFNAMTAQDEKHSDDGVKAGNTK